MGVPWTARRSNQIINTEYSTKGPMLLYLGHLMPRANSLEKDSDAGKDCEERATEEEMAGWHHQLNGYEFDQTPGDSEEQGSLLC